MIFRHLLVLSSFVGRKNRSSSSSSSSSHINS